MLNRCEFIGNLGADPDVRTTQSGDKVANLRLACTDRWKSKSGEQQERTEWVSVAILGRVVDTAEKYLSKGMRVYIAGQLRTRKWQDQKGEDRYSTEIVVSGFDGKMIMLGDRSSNGDSPQKSSNQPTYEDQSRGGPTADPLDDSVPFAPLRELP